MRGDGARGCSVQGDGGCIAHNAGGVVCFAGWNWGIGACVLMLGGIVGTNVIDHCGDRIVDELFGGFDFFFVDTRKPFSVICVVGGVHGGDGIMAFDFLAEGLRIRVNGAHCFSCEAADCEDKVTSQVVILVLDFIFTCDLTGHLKESAGNEFADRHDVTEVDFGEQ